ncbi:MAG: type II toxin-antitoxin system prevent-host-death family antitoxin [Candidatus Latescibacteria bacterium]|nr:type II toxin-antitoxin system prevent-host-death family antitoxin [Candidatus Latescibacterota bacterium]
MTTITTYTQARAALASLCDEVASTREPVIIRRRNAEDVALVSADELASLLETAHLLRSPKNAQRLLTAINRAQSRELSPASVEELRRELGLVEEKN